MWYGHKNLYVELLFASTTPKKVTQDYIQGDNDLFVAQAARWIYTIDNQPLADGFNRQWKMDFEVFLQTETSNWGDNSELLDTSAFTRDAWEKQFLTNVDDDLVYMVVAVLLILSYSFVVIGAMSPVHFRSVTALVGISCVLLSIASGYGIALTLGQLVSGFHSIIPFMILGIGVDDMFVIVNTIDQTPTHLSVNERFIEGLKHAGPSITITSVTNALAFIVGSLSTLPALRSLCIYASVIITLLYISFLTIFATFLLIDMRR